MIRHLLAPALTFLVLADFSPLGGHTPRAIFKVRWEKRMYEFDELEEAVGPEPVRAARGWKDWCEANDYHMVLSPDGRILLVVPKSEQGKKQLGLVLETMQFVDELLPAPDRPEGAGADASNSWGEARAPLGTETAVLLERHVGPSALEQMSEAFRVGKSWRRPKK